jgi:hypothetical protein
MDFAVPNTTTSTAVSNTTGSADPTNTASTAVSNTPGSDVSNISIR